MSLKTRLTRLAIAAALGLSMLGMNTSATAAPPPRVPAPLPAPGPVTDNSPITCGAPVNSSQNLSFQKRSWPLTGGLNMNTNGRVTRNSGMVDATVHIYNSYWGTGYTGSVMLLLRDNCGGLIGVTEPARWGVEAKAWFWNANERHEHYVARVDQRITSRVASVEVIHNRYTTGENMKASYNAARDIACINILKLINGTDICPIPQLSR
ncbi:MAG: hypothetical protein GX596_01385 [Propionibacterium sp.]|nr:hypothetical protein [Propionibacterium sp.]